MTVKLTETELARRAFIKSLRAAIRTKHSIQADAELNDVLPEAEKAFDRAIQRGTLPASVDVDEIIRAVVE